MESVRLPLDGGTMLRRRTIDFSTSRCGFFFRFCGVDEDSFAFLSIYLGRILCSPPCHNYACHSMIKPHSRGSTLHGLEEWSLATG